MEMQVKKEANLPKRSRYYHSQIDMEVLLSGKDYEQLPDTYVIFICDYDSMGENLYQYSLRTCCEENGRVVRDGSFTYWLNTKGSNDSKVSAALRSFLKYVENPKEICLDESSDFVQEVEKQVEQIKKSRDWEAKEWSIKKIQSSNI